MHSVHDVHKMNACKDVCPYVSPLKSVCEFSRNLVWTLCRWRLPKPWTFQFSCSLEKQNHGCANFWSSGDTSATQYTVLKSSMLAMFMWMGVRPCLWTAATNGPIIYPKDYYMSMENDGVMISIEETDSSIRTFWQSCQQISSSKSGGTAKEVNFALQIISFVSQMLL
jgi:hypothetical protein